MWNLNAQPRLHPRVLSTSALVVALGVVGVGSLEAQGRQPGNIKVRQPSADVRFVGPVQPAQCLEVRGPEPRVPPLDRPLVRLDFNQDDGAGTPVYSRGGWPLFLRTEVVGKVLEGLSTKDDSLQDDYLGSPGWGQVGTVWWKWPVEGTLRFTPGVRDLGRGAPGVHPTLSGLVVLAEGAAPCAPGLRRDRRGINLAGVLSSVGYELWDGSSGLRITAAAVIPEGLLLRDEAPSARAALPSSAAALSTGARTSARGIKVPEDPEPLPPCPSGEIEWQVHTTSVALRAFWVRGTAPEQLKDLDGDGYITALDADRAGFVRISNEARLTFDVLLGYSSHVAGGSKEPCEPPSTLSTAGEITHPPRNEGG